VARRMVEVLECDVCGSPDDVVSYTIAAPLGTSEVDLCVAHRSAVEDLFNIGRIRRRPGRRPRSEAAATTAAPARKAARKGATKKGARAKKTTTADKQ
jgi:hypothetical protein